MTISFKKVLLGMIALLLLVVQTTMNADIHEQYKTDEDSPEMLLRKATGAFDLQKNTVSNIEFYTTNYGIFGYNVANRTGGSHWPRNSLNQYIFAGGAWIGAKIHMTDPATGEKKFDEEGKPVLNKLCELTYNPRDGRSWMVPGRIHDENGLPTPLVDNDASAVQKYRTYFSTDFLGNGTPLDPTDGTNWPIWDSSTDPTDTLKTKRYFGYYIEESSLRSDKVFKKGPAFISGEDVFCTYKDTDLRYFEGGASGAKAKGYPFYMQFEQMIYSWGFGDYKDFVFIKYDLISFNPDTLRECWLAPVMDVDIAREPNTSAGAVNDRVRFYGSFTGEDTTLNMAVQWSQGDRGEAGRGFGYLGYDFLESPAVQSQFLPDSTINPLAGFLRRDKRKYTNEEQLGLQSFNNWNISEDKTEDAERYDFLSTYNRDGDKGSGDKRFMMATGPFNMLPYDTARVVVGIIIAPSVKDLPYPDGTTEDMANLVQRDMFAQTVYDNNFRAPQPPRRATLYATGVNNGVVLNWDDFSELSEDDEESGLDFMGYRLYRARRTDLDTFNTTQTEKSGPLGWRQIAQWQIPPAFEKSSYQVGDPSKSDVMPYIDSLRILGPVTKNGLYSDVDALDSFNIKVMRICNGCIMEQPNFFNSQIYVDSNAVQFNHLNLPVIVDIDTLDARGPWGKYFYSVANTSRLGKNFDQIRFEAAKPITETTPEAYGARVFEKRTEYLDKAYRYDPTKKDFLLDSILVGTVELQSALLDYNPLFYIKKQTVISAEDYYRYNLYVNDNFNFADHDTLRWEFHYTTDSVGATVKVKYRVDTIYYYSSAKPYKEAGKTKYVIDYATIHNTAQDIMSNAEHLSYINDLVYRYIQEGKAKVKFPLFEESEQVWVPVRDSVTGKIIKKANGEDSTVLETIYTYLDFYQKTDIREGLIPNYMAKVTNNRTFIDLGDNGDGYFYYSEDPTQTEQLYNNVDYFYKILSFDEGDYRQPTESKTNDASLALPNEVSVRPKAAPLTDDIKFDVEVLTPNKIGSLNNFKFFSLDDQRVSQFFAGHELELEFKPFWYSTSVTFTGNLNDTYFGKYYRQMILTDVTTGQVIYEGLTEFEKDPGNFAYQEAFTENGLSYVLNDKPIVDSISASLDTITFGLHDSRETVERFGTWTTGEMIDPGFIPYTGLYYFGKSYSGMVKPAYGALGFKFDYHIKQFGGDYRMDTIIVVGDKKVDVIMPRYTDEARLPLHDPDRKVDAKPFSYAGVNVATTQKIGQEDVYTRADLAISDNRYMNATMVNNIGNPIYASYNNGPATYELEFLEKKTTTIKVWIEEGSEKVPLEFTVDYLTTKLTNKTKFDRRNADGTTTEISYETPMEHINIPALPFKADGYSFYGQKESIGKSPGWQPDYANTLMNVLYTKAYPYPVNTVAMGVHPDSMYNKYNIFASAWVNVRNKRVSSINKPKLFARRMLEVNGQASFLNEDGEYEAWTGFQGGYLLRAQNANYTIDFVNVLYVSGVPFIFDCANQASNTPASVQWEEDQLPYEEFKYGETNFAPGDKLILSTTGGALGLPAPGAKVRIKVGGEPKNPNQFEDEDLEEIQVVPNPYFISHQGQKSPYGAELYFTRLPETCTIDIYTVTGELIKRIEHNEITSTDPNKVSVDIWDLLSDNNQRVASQALVAVISTPNGAQTIKNFSVIVGSYRIITD